MSALLRRGWPFAVLALMPALLLAEPEAKPRRPVALAVGPEARLFVANREGSITVLDAEKHKVTAEASVGRRLADLTTTPDGRLLAVDEEAHELIVLTVREGKPAVEQRLPVENWPVSVRTATDGSRCFVASLWSRTLSVVDLKPEPRVARTVTLPFAPRTTLPLSGTDRVLVADAFGGKLGVVDVRAGKVESVREVPGHNIRGLALSADGKRVLLTQQILSPYADTTLNEVHWGNLLTNNLRSVPVSALLDPKADVVRLSEVATIGAVGGGAGDPAGVAVAGDAVLIALAGVDELAVGTERQPGGKRLDVGRRPSAVALSEDGRTAFVANTFSGSVSVVDVAGRKSVTEVSLGAPGTSTPADEGERLFHDARLSHDGWMSCQSCHSDGHTNGKVSDTQGDGSFGAPKRVPSLRGVRDTAPYGWLGTFETLEAQVRHSLKTTMHGPRKLPDAQVRTLVAYLESLPPAPPRVPTHADAVKRGRGVFDAQGCAACHAPRQFTVPKTFDVGFSDEVGNQKFNPPSLRGVGQAGPYFHDGRAATLEEAFTKHRHQLKTELPRQQLDDLLAYLGSL
jgi:YVTN family beta-propeller protein